MPIINIFLYNSYHSYKAIMTLLITSSRVFFLLYQGIFRRVSNGVVDYRTSHTSEYIWIFVYLCIILLLSVNFEQGHETICIIQKALPTTPPTHTVIYIPLASLP